MVLRILIGAAFTAAVILADHEVQRPELLQTSKRGANSPIDMNVANWPIGRKKLQRVRGVQYTRSALKIETNIVKEMTKKQTKLERQIKRLEKGRTQKARAILYFVLDAFPNMFTKQDFSSVTLAIANLLKIDRQYLEIKMFPGSVIFKVIISGKVRSGEDIAKKVVQGFLAGQKKQEPFKLARFAVQLISLVEPFVGHLPNPTRHPSRPPTTYSTRLPSRTPTQSPTQRPSRPPTLHPTRRPTVAPTASPSFRPTIVPSRSPTHKPTHDPTVAPTRQPSRAPTVVPTRWPTAKPTTSKPTIKPTSAPSFPPQYRFHILNKGVHNFAGWCASSGVKIVAGDFNGDGKGDVACCGHKGWGSLPTAFGSGGGSYTVKNYGSANFATWAAARGAQMVAADFNGDGKTDVALNGPSGWGTVPIAFSNGNGQYTVTNKGIRNFASWAASSGAKLVTADFNGDKKADLALTGGHGWSTVPVAFSKGDGTFTVTNYRVSNIPSWFATSNVKVVAGDFNGDGKGDIAGCGPSGWSSLPTAFGQGDGKFSVTNFGISNFAKWCSQAGVQLIAADFNGDGKDDLALSGVKGWTTIPIASSQGNGRYVVTNNAAKHFAAWASTSGAHLVAAKFNTDKKYDLALAGGSGWSSLPTAFVEGG